MKSKTYRLKPKKTPVQLQSIGDWIRWSVSVFQEAQVHFGHGTDNAWDEAVQLVLQILHLPIDVDPKVFNTTLLAYEQQRLFVALRERVEARKPLPYITHQAWCLGVPFYVDERVLIPRSPFAEWIEKGFQPWVDADAVQHILEIGTGSACLAVLAALHFPQAQVDAVDIDPQALAVAEINVAKHGLQEQIRLSRSNLFAQLDQHKQYDIIFSNPPDVGEAEMQTLPPEYHHEPLHALQAADDGLALVIDMLRHGADYLTDNGILMVELGYSAAALQQRFPRLAFTWLHQENGGEGLFLLTKNQLNEALAHSLFLEK